MTGDICISRHGLREGRDLLSRVMPSHSAEQDRAARRGVPPKPGFLRRPCSRPLPAAAFPTVINYLQINPSDEERGAPKPGPSWGPVTRARPWRQAMPGTVQHGPCPRGL